MRPFRSVLCPCRRTLPDSGVAAAPLARPLAHPWFFTFMAFFVFTLVFACVAEPYSVGVVPLVGGVCRALFFGFSRLPCEFFGRYGLRSLCSFNVSPAIPAFPVHCCLARHAVVTIQSIPAVFWSFSPPLCQVAHSSLSCGFTSFNCRDGGAAIRDFPQVPEPYESVAFQIL